jgi:O-antigen/teichoic acid export membrane protein
VAKKRLQADAHARRTGNSTVQATGAGHKIVTTVGTQATIQLVGLATGVLVARLAGVEGRGELAAIVTWVSALTYLGDLGMPVAYTYTAAHNPNRIRQLLGNALIASAMQWLVIGVVGTIILLTAFARTDRGTAGFALIFLWAYVPLNLVTRYLVALHQGLGRFVWFNAVRMSVPLSYLLFLALLFLAKKATVEWILAAVVGSNVVAVLLAIASTAAAGPRAWPSFDGSLLRKNLRYGLRAYLGSVEPLNGLRVDVLILTVLVSAYNLGLYSVAVSAAAALKALGTAFGLVALPEVARAASWSQRKAVASRIFWITSTVVGVFALAIAFWAEPLVSMIYGTPFAGAAVLVQVMLLAAAANTLYALLRDILQGFGHPLRSSIPEMVSLGVAVPALVFSVPKWGVLGGAWSVAGGSIAAFGVAAYLLRTAGAHKGRAASIEADVNGYRF